MEDKKITNRRKVILGLTGGIAGVSQLPSRWTKPVVDSVILPAHAQTSVTTTPAPTTTAAPGVTTTTTTTTMAPLPTNFRGNVGTGFSDNGFDKIISAFISDAHAGGFPGMGDCCVNSPDGMGFDLKLLVGNNGFFGFYETSGTVGGGAQMVTDSNGCFPTTLSIGVSGITAAGAAVEINGAMSNVPEGMGCPSNPGPSDDCQGQLSDIRLKTDIHKLDATVNSHQLYRFKYLDDPNQTDYVGVMAQDILKTHPNTVTRREDGNYAVFYNQLGLKMTTLEEWEKYGIEAITTKLQ